MISLLDAFYAYVLAHSSDALLGILRLERTPTPWDRVVLRRFLLGETTPEPAREIEHMLHTGRGFVDDLAVAVRSWLEGLATSGARLMLLRANQPTAAWEPLGDIAHIIPPGAQPVEWLGQVLEGIGSGEFVLGASRHPEGFMVGGVVCQVAISMHQPLAATTEAAQTDDEPLTPQSFVREYITRAREKGERPTGRGAALARDALDAERVALGLAPLGGSQGFGRRPLTYWLKRELQRRR